MRMTRPTATSQGNQLFIFESKTRPGLCAFSDSASGERLPEHHGPWVSAEGGITPRLSTHDREAVAAAIKTSGFQMWRKRT